MMALVERRDLWVVFGGGVDASQSVYGVQRSVELGWLWRLAHVRVFLIAAVACPRLLEVSTYDAGV